MGFGTVFKKKFFCVLKNLSALFGCAKKPFCSFRMDQFFPFVANELKFVVKIKKNQRSGEVHHLWGFEDSQTAE